jgi:capsid assembly protease
MDADDTDAETMKRRTLTRLREALFTRELTQQAIWQIHEPALQALVDLLLTERSGRSAESGEISQPDPETIAQRLGMHASDAPTTQMVGQVAVLPILGVLQQKASWVTRYMGWTATEILERDFRAAIGDASVKAIVLYCDSPGGTAIGNEEVARTIFQARGTKPIVAFVRGLCASACYYLASAADKVIASPSSTVGSIGTIWTHFEYSKAFAAMGIGINVLRHGENKGIGNLYEPLKPEARAKLQKWIDDYGGQFEAAVARGRGITAADVRSKFGQGDAFLAAEAKSRGMIDGVASWEQVLASLKTGPAPVPQVGQELGVSGQGSGARSRESGVRVQAGELAAGWPLADQVHYHAELPEAAGRVSTGEATMKVSLRVRAALFARGFITAQDVDDGVCLAALGAYFAARGEACPQEDDKVLSALLSVGQLAAVSGQLAAATGAGTQLPTANGQLPATNVRAAHEREIAEARAAAAADERGRQAAIRASGQLLSMSAEAVQAAIDGGKPHAEVIGAWHEQLTTREKPVGQNTTPIHVGPDGSQRFAADAQLALLSRLDRVPASQVGQVTEHVQQLSQAPLRYYAEQCLAMSGVRVPQFIGAEELFEMAFAMDGVGRTTVGANYAAANRPGSFPNLLSNLANKILDSALKLSKAKYGQWTGMWPGDLPDFKPAPVINKSQHDELDEILDAEASKEFGLAEEMLSYMILRRYSNKFSLTPVMAANDDLAAFDEGLLGLELSWENTVNRLCLGLLTGNVTLLDGFALFDNTNHGNDVTTTGAGPPSVATWQVMELRMAAQRGIGGKGYLGTQLDVALVPPNHKLAALQTFAPLQQFNEIKQPTTDATLNVYRGVAEVAVEAELQAASNDVWYGLAKPQGMLNATIVRAYFRGWGKNGRRQRWYDPETKCWNFELEGRVGAAAKQYRTIVRNDGVP